MTRAERGLVFFQLRVSESPIRAPSFDGRTVSAVSDRVSLDHSIVDDTHALMLKITLKATHRERFSYSCPRRLRKSERFTIPRQPFCGVGRKTLCAGDDGVSVGVSETVIERALADTAQA